jgi:hypothetical protein
MTEQEQIVSLIQEHMGWSVDKALLWLTTPNPSFGCIEPIYLIQMGRGHKVLDFVKAAIDGEDP